HENANSNQIKGTENPSSTCESFLSDAMNDNIYPEKQPSNFRQQANLPERETMDLAGEKQNRRTHGGIATPKVSIAPPRAHGLHRDGGW
ncbi:hypothetical protein A2U01_0029623, partial [Trifolium medium]|nr:hypothetical protein [Trifolium medium]